MNESKLQLVSFEQAQKLKELGFDWGCEYVYNLHNINPNMPSRKFETISHNHNYEGEKSLASAPTVTLALKWFRDVKGYQMSIIFDAECDDKYEIDILINDYDEDEDEEVWNSIMGSYTLPKSYDEAEIKILDVLIELELYKNK